MNLIISSANNGGRSEERSSRRNRICMRSTAEHTDQQLHYSATQRGTQSHNAYAPRQTCSSTTEASSFQVFCSVMGHQLVIHYSVLLVHETQLTVDLQLAKIIHIYVPMQTTCSQPVPSFCTMIRAIS